MEAPLMRERIDAFFTMIEIVTERLPSLARFIVELALPGLVILGVISILRGHL
jgi:hypothetical protein